MNISIKPLYEVNQVVDIVCNVVANPLPVIEWAFRPCNFQGGTEDCQFRASDDLSVSYLRAVNNVMLLHTTNSHTCGSSLVLD